MLLKDYFFADIIHKITIRIIFRHKHYDQKPKIYTNSIMLDYVVCSSKESYLRSILN